MLRTASTAASPCSDQLQRPAGSRAPVQSGRDVPLTPFSSVGTAAFGATRREPLSRAAVCRSKARTTRMLIEQTLATALKVSKCRMSDPGPCMSSQVRTEPAGAAAKTSFAQPCYSLAANLGFLRTIDAACAPQQYSYWLRPAQGRVSVGALRLAVTQSCAITSCAEPPAMAATCLRRECLSIAQRVQQAIHQQSCFGTAPGAAQRQAARMSTAPADSSAQREQEIAQLLREKMPGVTAVQVQDTSGGCGSMYRIEVAAEEFKCAGLLPACGTCLRPA